MRKKRNIRSKSKISLGDSKKGYGTGKNLLAPIEKKAQRAVLATSVRRA